MVFSIAVDSLHAIKSGSKKTLSPERYYYTNANRFEQSLDIYRPPPSSHSPSSPPLPVVTLVVGSAWLGHRYCIYSGCSWWNSSGPKTIAKLGCVSVCIRHRGAFPRTCSPLSILFVAIMAGVLVTLLNWFIETDRLTYVEELVATHVGVGVAAVPLGRTGAFLLTFFLGLVAIELAGNGSASFDQMQNDVMDALVYLEKNKKRLGLNISSDAKFIFGGYSSGGHVAATVTQQPHLWKERNLPSPEIYCDSLLYISPVLSTKPYAEMCRQLSSLSSSSLSMMSPSTSMPSLAPSEVSQSNDQNAAGGRALEKAPSFISSSTLSLLKSTSPQWLTSELVKAIFGHTAAQLPSPIHTYNKSPSVPHTFVGCRNEMFGLNWLDLFFCSPIYCELLKGIGIDSRYVSVESDHWNILNSTVLCEALKEEIKLVQMRRHSRKS